MILDHRSVCPALLLIGAGLIRLGRYLAHPHHPAPKESR